LFSPRCRSPDRIFLGVGQKAIPVIAVTASVMAQERQKVMAAGFDGFQGKPISVRELLETVRHVLDKSAP